MSVAASTVTAMPGLRSESVWRISVLGAGERAAGFGGGDFRSECFGILGGEGDDGRVRSDRDVAVVRNAVDDRVDRKGRLAHDDGLAVHGDDGAVEAGSGRVDGRTLRFERCPRGEVAWR